MPQNDPLAAVKEWLENYAHLDDTVHSLGENGIEVGHLRALAAECERLRAEVGFLTGPERVSVKRRVQMASIAAEAERIAAAKARSPCCEGVTSSDPTSVHSPGCHHAGESVWAKAGSAPTVKDSLTVQPEPGVVPVIGIPITGEPRVAGRTWGDLSPEEREARLEQIGREVSEYDHVDEVAGSAEKERG